MPICKTLFLNQTFAKFNLGNVNFFKWCLVYLNVTNVIEDRDFAAVFVLPILDPSGPIWMLSRIYLTGQLD